MVSFNFWSKWALLSNFMGALVHQLNKEYIIHGKKTRSKTGHEHFHYKISNMQIQDFFIRFFMLHSGPLTLQFYENLKMKLPLYHIAMLIVSVVINVTSFSSFTEEKSEYWFQKQTLSGILHSIILLTYLIRLFKRK